MARQRVARASTAVSLATVLSTVGNATIGAAFRRAMPSGMTAALISIALIVAAAPSAHAASSTTTIRSSLNPSQVGQAVTFTARVYGSSGGAPTGTITFRDDGNALGGAVSVGTMGVGSSVAAGNNHTCALTAAGGVQCWGWNNIGQLGDGTTGADRKTPVDVLDAPGGSPLTGVVAVAAGSVHTCALMATGGVKCWGRNHVGQLGDGTNIQSTTPVDVLDAPGGSPLTGVVAVAAGNGHTCALMATGGVKCWGLNDNRQLGDDTNINRASPVDVLSASSGPALTGVVAVAAGDFHTCALMDAGGVKCWGFNGNGRLGDGTTFSRSTPVDVLVAPAGSPVTGMTAIAAGSSHTCALMDAGGVKCWGFNGDGRLGDGTNTQSSSPVDVLDVSGSSPLTGVAAIAAGSSHTCALTEAGGVQCWGFNGNGQLGDGTTTDHNTPVDVLVAPAGSPVTGMTAIATGGSHTCALTEAGGVQCWGFNNNGQLGDNSFTQSNTPVDVSGLGAGTVLVSGEATFTTSALTAGIHTITAEFTGDTHNPSDSALTQNVNVAPQFTIISGFGGFAVGAAHTATLTASGFPVPSITLTGTLPSGLTLTDHGDGTAEVSGTPAAGSVGSYPVTLRTENAAGFQQIGSTITVNKGNQTISFLTDAPGAATAGGSYAVEAAATSGLTVTFGASGACSYSGAVQFDTAGSCTVTASQGGDASYNAAPDETQTFSIAKADQTISFDTLEPTNAVLGGSYAAAATATSGLPVTLDASGACSYSGGAVRFSALGSCTVTANQGGNSTYNPAPQKTQTFSIGKASSTVLLRSFFGPSVYGEAVRFKALVSGSGGGAPTGNVRFKDGGDLLGSAASVDILGVGQSVAAGFIHTCVLTAGGGVTCWGDNARGQLGDGTIISRLTPVDVLVAPGGSPLTDIVATVTGASHTCALTAGGGVKCWGQNGDGQLGDGTSDFDPHPTPVDVLASPGGSPLTSVIAIAAGTAHTCALMAGGGVKCWGSSSGFDALGDGTGLMRATTPVDVSGLTSAVAIAAGNSHACALTAAGGVKCWGRNDSGQAGDGANSTSRAAPTDVLVTPGGPLLTGVVAVTAGGNHTCALMAAGGAKCWGRNDSGQVGDDTTTNHNTPVDVLAAPGGSALTGVAAIAAGGSHTCALTAGGGVKCWGSNASGQLGDDTTTNHNTPVDVLAAPGGSPLTGVVTIDAGFAHNCALTAGGGLECWGSNDSAQLGDGTGTQRTTPVVVSGLGTGSMLVFGEATLTTTSLTGGPHAITAVYSGDDNHDGSTSSALTHTVNQADQTINFSSTATAPTVGGSYTPAATATSSLPVTFGASGSCTFGGGKVKFTAPGHCTVTANQPGDANYNPAPQKTQDITVAKAATSVTARAAPATVRPGKPVTVTAVITAPAGLTPGGTVTFKEGNKTLGTVAVATKKVQLAVPSLTIGTHIITANYSGDANLTKSSATTTATVTAALGLGGEARVNSTTGGAQPRQQPAIAALKAGYVIVWTAQGQDGAGKGVYLQRYTAIGKKAGNETPVNTVTAGGQSEPAVAGLANGNFVAVWQSAKEDRSGLGIFGQMFKANGTKSGAPFRVNTTTPNDQSLPAIAALADGGFIVAWTSAGQDGDGLGIYAQRYAADGVANGAEFKVNTTTTGHQSAPSVAGLTGGGFVIAWQGPDAGGLGVYAQRYNTDGKAQGKETPVNKTTANDQTLPSVAALDNGGFVVAWQSNLQDGSGLGVFMQRFNAKGAKSGNEARVNTTTANDQGAPSAAGFSDGGYVVVWTSKNQDGAGQGVFAQVFTTAGTKVNAEFGLNETTAGTQSQPAVAAFASGRFAAAWTSNNQDGDGPGIYARRFQVPFD